MLRLPQAPRWHMDATGRDRDELLRTALELRLRWLWAGSSALSWRVLGMTERVTQLSEEQAWFARMAVGRWIAIKERETGQKPTPADADHSALLFRLLRGREPFPEPPPLLNAYPAYPDWPYVDVDPAEEKPSP